MSGFAEISVRDGQVTVWTPPGVRFEHIAVQLGGIKEGDSWRFAAELEPKVREACKRVVAERQAKLSSDMRRAADLLRELDVESATPGLLLRVAEALGQTATALRAVAKERSRS